MVHWISVWNSIQLKWFKLREQLNVYIIFCFSAVVICQAFLLPDIIKESKKVWHATLQVEQSEEYKNMAEPQILFKGNV